MILLELSYIKINMSMWLISKFLPIEQIDNKNY